MKSAEKDRDQTGFRHKGTYTKIQWFLLNQST